MSLWDRWVDAALSELSSKKLLRSTRPISLPSLTPAANPSLEIETFDGPGPWDRSSVEVQIDEPTFREWLSELPFDGVEGIGEDENVGGGKMLLFSGNDYLGLSSHPAVRSAAAKAAREVGMGPRGSALICGYTNYHKQLEISLANLKKKEDCVLCPTGFAANLAFMTALGSISSLLSLRRTPSDDERVAIFSDALNHASIIDGIRLAEKQQGTKVFVYRHCDMAHLDSLLSCCTLRRKVVITDSLFSMDGDFAPLPELVALRRKHGFLLAIDDAHATLVCGESGGGAAEIYECEDEVDICIGTLSKAAGCNGGFIACSNTWKQLIQSRGRAFIFSTSLAVPIAAASHAAISVARKEKWRRSAIWSRVKEFNSLTRLSITSPIISLVIGSEEAALRASRHMLRSGFHVTAIRPPTVAPNSCRLRITLTAAHTTEDIKRLAAALSPWISAPVLDHSSPIVSKL
ncbi:8-amino-7-oxononanoate synthase-like isoform X2 [Ananas comosus]|uniref:serine C-palmitoyltransferase n=1 Tax=Ananas comosus TaxID=4615 RepID=A0A6P5FJC2_ANACO|nr:8-amino-7-oxononanoate synthase-like isoform X2 [Ananas comosus]